MHPTKVFHHCLWSSPCPLPYDDRCQSVHVIHYKAHCFFKERERDKGTKKKKENTDETLRPGTERGVKPQWGNGGGNGERGGKDRREEREKKSKEEEKAVDVVSQKQKGKHFDKREAFAALCL